ncbi:hypothetical protein MBLNU230_g7454t1 [Neophaeotheca triangularis]
MDDFLAIQGLHATASQSGELVASIAASHLRIHLAARPTDYSDFGLRIAPKDITSLVWSEGADHIAVVSAQCIEVVDLQEQRRRVRLDNGAGGLGRFSAADFVGEDLLFVVWEFGRSKIWDIRTGKGVEAGEVKTTCDGTRWARRPGSRGDQTQLALLSRQGAEDFLTILFPASYTALPSGKLRTTDAQALSWSPDGNWLAILDSPSASPYSVHIYTPDGQCFRSCPEPATDMNLGLGIKSIHWSPDAGTLALAGHDSRITILNARTFSPTAVIEHSTVIDQAALPLAQRASIWQEIVSPSHMRSYKYIVQPFSPPVSRTKPALEPAGSGIAEACFSQCGRFLATRDERMLSSVWVWDMQTLAAHAVLVQHANVRKMQWYCTKGSSKNDYGQQLLLDCGENVAYLWSAVSRSPDEEAQPPATVSTELKSNTTFNYLPGDPDRPALLASTRGCFQLLRPYGMPSDETFSGAALNPPPVQQTDDSYALKAEAEAGKEQDEAEGDSLLDLLSGRTPMPAKSEPSYTEKIDAEAEDATATGELQDTFRGKHLLRRSPPPVEAIASDPFNDSEIF